MIIHEMNKDQSSKEELKEQVVELTAYIQQSSSTKEIPTNSYAPPLLLSKENIKKLERRKK